MSGTVPAPPLVAGVHVVADLLQTSQDEMAVQYILADVSLFAVGVFSTGAFTFLLVSRKVTWVVSILHISIFLAFTAAILDLVKVLFTNNTGRSSTISQDANPIFGLVFAREIIYAVSAGFRFLFFWAFVACPPRGYPRKRQGLHSASWARWGVPGFILRWITLGVVFAITTLQVFYRASKSLHEYNLIYVLEGILEISVLAIFALKVVLNIYLVRLDTVAAAVGRTVFYRYLAFLIALGINVAIAVGNILDFLFSETVLGRFLLAIETYILILFILIYSFVQVLFEPEPKQPLIRSSSFRGLTVSLSRESTFRVPPPRVSTPDLASALRESSTLQSAQPIQERPGSLAKVSARLSRLSTFLKPRRLSSRTAASEYPMPDPYYFEADVEQGKIVDNNRYSRETQIVQDFARGYPERRNNVADDDRSFVSTAPRTNSTANLLTTPRGNTKPLSPLPRLKPLVIPSPRQSPLAVQYSPRTISPDSPGRESPIYGLQGIVRPPPPPSTFDDRSLMDDPRDFYFERTSGISGLLRQQEELESSIAALGLFAGRSQPISKRSTLTESLGTPKPPSAAHSDFSLSNFPEPPWGRKSVEGRVMMVSPPSTNAERVVEVTQGDDSRSMVASQARRESVAATVVPPVPPRSLSRILNSPPVSPQISPTTAYSQDGSTYSAPAKPSAEYRRSMMALQPIAEASSSSARKGKGKGKGKGKARASPEISLPREELSRQLTSPPSTRPRARRALPVPPQSRPATRGTLVAPVAPGPSLSVPGLANRRVGLPSNPRLGPRGVVIPPLLSSQALFERPRAAPNPSAPR